MTHHPKEQDLALLASNDCGAFKRFLLNRHVAHCGDCQETVSSFSELRTATTRSATKLDGPEWDRLAAEMRANIHLGLVAGECVRQQPEPKSFFNRQWAIGLAGVVLLAGTGLFLRSQLPHQTSNAHEAVLQSTGSGIEVRSDSGSMTILNHSDAVTSQSVTAQGAIQASYVDSGTVTVTSVYVE